MNQFVLLQTTLLLPDGLEEDQVYFTIKGSNNNDIKVARTLNDALEATPPLQLTTLVENL